VPLAELGALAAFGGIAPGAIVLVLSLVVPDVPVFPPAVPVVSGVVVLAVEDDFVSVEPVVSSRLWHAVREAAAIVAITPSWANLIRFMRNFLVEKPRMDADATRRAERHALQQRPRSASGP
jgi:hypothetical protein